MSANKQATKKEFDPVTFFTKKELCYYKMIDKYFKSCPQDKIIKMLSIINKESDISLRILDWFITKYSKRGVDFLRNGDVFDVHINYKAQLKSYKKRYFDPFKRKKKFNYKYIVNGEEKVLYTTIGQLNFFRWAISNEIIDFVEKSLAQIIKAMNLSKKENKKKKNDKSDDSDESDDNSSDDSDSEDSSKHNGNQKRKKESINVGAVKNVKNDEIELVLCFD
jgi:hypothetical protein